MNFKQTITEYDYKIAYEFNYKTDKRTKFRPLYATFIILIGSILILRNLFFILKKDSMDKEVGIDNVIEFLKGAGIEQREL